ncbi:tetratricopeptide repeat protein [Fusobacterium necrophorum]|uniref:Tetratricopeptide repeat protein n=1 Tax=Fusobacterium necrophorum TaxID=859 RepID=A0A4Q2KZS8_9FUSO|nr:tetratricopeptide repeat protein [Fusobacterium necrophorum]RXZ69533.1 tetratricopeptide repeat protein [Fusobacterium necrophorum]
MQMQWNKGIKEVVSFLFLSFSLWATGEIREIEMIGVNGNKISSEKGMEDAILVKERKEEVEVIPGKEELVEKTQEVATFTSIFQKGNALFMQKQYEKANAVFKSDFSDMKNVFGAATTDRFLGRHSQAIEEYTKVLQVNAEFGEAYLGRALSYRDSGKYSEAISDFQQYLALTQGEDGYLGLGDTYMAMGDYSKAQQILAQGSSKYPNSNLMKKMMSQAYLKTK